MRHFLLALLVVFARNSVWTDGAWYNPVDLMCRTMSFTPVGECCRYAFIRTAESIRDFREVLNNEFFGQHIAVATVLNAIEDHLTNENPEKPLVLSFHGQPGCGKSFLSKLIAATLFMYGEQSHFYTFHSTAKDFGNRLEIQRYRDELKREVHSKLSMCDRALFIFDEVDDMPPAILDGLVTYLDRNGYVDGIPIARATYIFLSNIGESNITEITLDSPKREDLTRLHFENILSKVALAETDTGFSRCKLIERHLVDFFIPFLPMERRHVIQCAKAEIEKRGLINIITPDLVADRITYGPRTSNKFAVSGCKKVAAEVGQVKMRTKFKNEF